MATKRPTSTYNHHPGSPCNSQCTLHSNRWFAKGDCKHRRQHQCRLLWSVMQTAWIARACCVPHAVCCHLVLQIAGAQHLRLLFLRADQFTQLGQQQLHPEQRLAHSYLSSSSNLHTLHTHSCMHAQLSCTHNHHLLLPLQTHYLPQTVYSIYIRTACPSSSRPAASHRCNRSLV